MRFILSMSVAVLLAFVPAAPGLASVTPSPSASSAAETSEPAFGIRLLDVPTSTQDDPRARTYIVDRVSPGSEISRRVRVENRTGAEATIRLYSGAARIEAGAFIGEESSVRSELSTWTTPAEPEVTLDAGESADVMVTIDVPADAPEGEQYGAVWAEMRGRAGDGGVVQANRVGIRIYLSVGPGNGPPADFTVTAITPSRGPEGNPGLEALVTNTGGRALDVTGDLTLGEGPGGLTAGPFAVQAPTTIAPGDAQVVVFSLPPELPDGPWLARLTLRSGLVEREMSASISFPVTGAGEATVPAEDTDTVSPALIALAAALLLGLVVAIMLLRHRMSRRREFLDVN